MEVIYCSPLPPTTTDGYANALSFFDDPTTSLGHALLVGGRTYYSLEVVKMITDKGAECSSTFGGGGGGGGGGSNGGGGGGSVEDAPFHYCLLGGNHCEVMGEGDDSEGTRIYQEALQQHIPVLTEYDLIRLLREYSAEGQATRRRCLSVGDLVCLSVQGLAELGSKPGTGSGGDGGDGGRGGGRRTRLVGSSRARRDPGGAVHGSASSKQGPRQRHWKGRDAMMAGNVGTTAANKAQRAKEWSCEFCERSWCLVEKCG